LEIRRDSFPDAPDLRSRKPFKIVLHHQKGFPLITIVLAHAQGGRAGN
jgi:hypothetical protein